MASLLKSLLAAALALLLLNSPSTDAHVLSAREAQAPLRPFAIRAHVSAQESCSTEAEFNLREKQWKIKASHCKTYDAFRAFSYDYVRHRHFPHEPDYYGECPVKVFSKPDCKGEVLLDIDNAGSSFGRCWTEQFELLPGRSVRVGKCRPHERP